MLLKIFSNIEKSRPCGFGQSLGQPKNNCPVSGNFWSVSGNFWYTKKKFGRPKKILVHQKEFWSTKNSQRLTKNSQRLTKNSLRLDNYFFGRPKKMRKRQDNWSTKRLTKTTWTGLQYKKFKWHYIAQI